MSSPEEELRLAAGMKPIEEMTEREIAEETLFWIRYAGTALQAMQNGGMGKMMMSMLSSRK